MGIISLIIFVYRQKYLDVPYINLKVFKDIRFNTTTFAAIAAYFARSARACLLPTYVQEIKGSSVAISGALLRPETLLMLFYPIAGRVYDRYEVRPLIIVSGSFIGIGSLLMFLLLDNAPMDDCNNLWNSCSWNLCNDNAKYYLGSR